MLLPVDKALRKAQNYIKAGELAEAEELYKQVLSKFPKNKKAIQGYQKLKAGITSKGSSNSEPPQEQVQELINLYNQGQFEEVLAKVKPLVSLFPKETILLNIQGVCNELLKRYDAAIDNYKQALKIKPDYADAYYNMGNSLNEKGELSAAIDSYKQALKIKPYYADVYNNMGNALKNMDDLDAAIDSYKQAIKIKPGHAEAYNNMGIALKDKGELNAAIVSYKQAIRIKPDYADAYNNMGIALNDKGESNAAVDSYKQAIKLNPYYAEAFNNMGNSLKDRGELDAAIVAYKQAIKIKPDYAEVYLAIGTVEQSKGNLEVAIDSYKQAIKITPNFVEAYYQMGNALTDVKFTKPKPDLPELIVKLLNDKTYLRPTDISRAAISLIKLDGTFQSVLRRYFAGDLGQVLELAISDLSSNSLLLKLMELCPLADLEIEELLTHLRSKILRNISILSGSKETLAFQSALALQCFTNEYIYYQTDEDTKALEDLEVIVRQNLANGQQPDPLVLACLASYKSLHHYPWCPLLALPDNLKKIEKRQILNGKQETALCSKLPVLIEITDDVSSKVRQQYEQNPYPRWVNLGVSPKTKSIAETAKSMELKISNIRIYNSDTPQILIAGCGTGQHSIGTASNFTNCDVIAIDLSLSSLAYAQRKTEELGLKNINYMQADILDLGKLGRQFDIIESVGVLHHMNDPMAGWRALTDCLKPSGLMNIGLYSELGRQDVVEMRNQMKLLDWGSDETEIKAFRREMIGSEKKYHKQILSSFDFYSLSMLRDLLFHVQEHRFTLNQIKNCLADLNLEFCGFQSKKIVDKFKLTNVETEDLYELDKWEMFEEDNPRSFAGMYQFWCQKI